MNSPPDCRKEISAAENLPLTSHSCLLVKNATEDSEDSSCLILVPLHNFLWFTVLDVNEPGLPVHSMDLG